MAKAAERGIPAEPTPCQRNRINHQAPRYGPVAAGLPPQFTAAQAAAGKTAYNANCAVCHGSTLDQRHLRDPARRRIFSGNTWTGKNSLGALYTRAQKTMPPSRPGSLAKHVYAEILAHILEVNGFKAGKRRAARESRSVGEDDHPISFAKRWPALGSQRHGATGSS